MGSLGERSILVFQLSICFQIKKKDYLKETTMESQHGDAENPNQAFVFSEKSIRLGFIRKVYSILMLQLVITFGIMSIFVFINDVRQYSMDHPEIYYSALGIYIGLALILSCCGDIRRRAPVNIILLGLLTASMGLMLGSIAAYFSVDEVLYAVGICTFICLALTLFTFQTKIDFTLTAGSLGVLGLNLLIFGLMAAIWQTQLLNITYCVLGTLIFSLYLVVDTQLILGGYRYAISPEEYIFAALILYLDIIQLLLFILQIIGGSTKK